MRVGILDSCPIYILGLARIISEEGMQVVGTALSPFQPCFWSTDVLLLDPDTLPPASAAEYIAERAAQQAVLVVAPNPRAECEKLFYEAGAAGVINRCELPDMLVNAIWKAAGVLPDATAAQTALQPGPAAVPPVAADRERPLSSREEEVLRQISQGLTHSQIARRLGISRHTVDTYVKRVRAKLGVGNKAELTRVALLGRVSAGHIPHADPHL